MRREGRRKAVRGREITVSVCACVCAARTLMSSLWGLGEKGSEGPVTGTWRAQPWG